MISFPLTAEYVWPKHNFFLTGESSLHMQDHIEFCHTLHTRPFPCNVRIPFLVHVVEISFSPKYFCNSVIFCLMCRHFDNLAFLKNSLVSSSHMCNIESETTCARSCTCTCSCEIPLGIERLSGSLQQRFPICKEELGWTEDLSLWIAGVPLEYCCPKRVLTCGSHVPSWPSTVPVVIIIWLKNSWNVRIRFKNRVYPIRLAFNFLTCQMF